MNVTVLPDSKHGVCLSAYFLKVPSLTTMSKNYSVICLSLKHGNRIR